MCAVVGYAHRSPATRTRNTRPQRTPPLSATLDLDLPTKRDSGGIKGAANLSYVEMEFSDLMLDPGVGASVRIVAATPPTADLEVRGTGRVCERHGEREGEGEGERERERAPQLR